MDQSQMYSNQIDTYLNEELAKNSKRIEELKNKKEELEKSLDSVGFLKKREINKEIRNINNYINYLKEKNVNFNIVKQEIAECRFAGQTSLSSVSQNVIKSLEIVASRLEKVQVTKLQHDLDSAVRDSQIHKPKRDVTSAFEKLEKQMNKLKIDDKRLEDSINRFKNAKLNEISSKMQSVQLVNLKPMTNIDDVENTKYIDMDNLIKSSDFRNNPDMAKIKSNYKNIKTQLMIRDKNNNLIESIDISLSAIVAETKQSSTDFSNLITDLNSYKEEANKKVKEADKYLSKFKINVLEKELDSYEEKHKFEETYGQLADDKEQAKIKGDHTKVAEIERKMAELGKGHSDSEIKRLQGEAKDKVFNENSEKQIVDNSKDKTFEEEQLEINAIANNKIEYRRKTIDENEELLRQIAIEKLEYDGVDLNDDNREVLIQEAIENISELSRLTPSQRREIAGNKNPNDDYMYTDEMLGFSAKKFIQAEDNIKRNMEMQATTIKGEYLKYLAKTDNKEDVMPYSEFAAMRYGYTNINEELLDEKSKKEIEEAGRSR